MTKFEMVAGLEIHVRLKTKTKLFCHCSNHTFSQEANSLICPVCAGFPGTLPMLNQEAVSMAIKSSLALNCKIEKFSKFDRKSYFYPDLPAGFQISQLDFPIAKNGHIDFFINSKEKKSIRINRLHLENDAGKLMHEGKNSLVNLNRAGSPLVEVVTEPDFKSAEEVFFFLKEFQKIFRYIETSDAYMEKGMMRCDVNISVKPKDSPLLGTKVEIKNMNSFSNAKKAVEIEFTRQCKLLNQGEKIIQETRGFDAQKQITISQRNKEESADYRYFPEPDLPPLIIEEQEISTIKNNLTMLPLEKMMILMEKFNLPFTQAEILSADKKLITFFEQAVEISQSPQKTANWILSDLMALLNEKEIEIDQTKMTPKILGNLVSLIESGKISGKIGKEIFIELFETGQDPEKLIIEKNLIVLSDEGEIEKIIDEIINQNEKIVQDFKNGKEKALGALVGSVMKATKGKASPQIVNKILREKLS